MEQFFGYIIGLGAAVMMPILFTILGVCIGIKFGKALKSGLLVGVGFVGLSVVTALLTSSLGDPLKRVTEIYGLSLGIFDMGWPAAASVAYNTSVGAFIIPVCLAVNIVMLHQKRNYTDEFLKSCSVSMAPKFTYPHRNPLFRTVKNNILVFLRHIFERNFKIHIVSRFNSR